MDLTLSPEQQTFRDEVRSWLRANAAHDLPPYDSADGFEAARAWERRMFEAGYAGMHWPREYGGRGLGVVEQAIFEEEYFLAGGPSRVTVLGMNLMGPTLMVHGTPEQKERWLRRILAAEDIWSQGFSEPGAGSDLAGLRTRAVLEGDHFIVTGQKIWTSLGAHADWIFALVRTDPDAPRHRGITFLAIDMRSPGVEPRPIVQADGHAGFAEVFFTDVRVPRDQAIGDVNGGWGVAMTTLGFERDAPSKPAARYLKDVRDLAALARARGRDGDPLVRDRVGGFMARAQAYRAHTLRTLTRLARGESIGSDASVTKVAWSELEREMYEYSRDLLGPDGEVFEDGGWRRKYWFARAATIYAGTSEIQRNVIAERVLGLPKG